MEVSLKAVNIIFQIFRQQNVRLFLSFHSFPKDFLLIFMPFLFTFCYYSLDETARLHKKSCPSVRPSIRPPVRPAIGLLLRQSVPCYFQTTKPRFWGWRNLMACSRCSILFHQSVFFSLFFLSFCLSVWSFHWLFSLFFFLPSFLAPFSLPIDFLLSFRRQTFIWYSALYFLFTRAVFLFSFSYSSYLSQTALTHYCPSFFKRPSFHRKVWGTWNWVTWSTIQG